MDLLSYCQCSKGILRLGRWRFQTAHLLGRAQRCYRLCLWDLRLHFARDSFSCLLICSDPVLPHLSLITYKEGVFPDKQS